MTDTPEHIPIPADDVQTIELDPPTAYVLVELLDAALQDGGLVEKPYEHAAFARLLSQINTENAPRGELTPGVKENTVLDGFPGNLYQEVLFDYYTKETAIEAPAPEA